MRFDTLSQVFNQGELHIFINITQVYASLEKTTDILNLLFLKGVFWPFSFLTNFNYVSFIHNKGFSTGLSGFFSKTLIQHMKWEDENKDYLQRSYEDRISHNNTENGYIWAKPENYFWILLIVCKSWSSSPFSVEAPVSPLKIRIRKKLSIFKGTHETLEQNSQTGFCTMTLSFTISNSQSNEA